MTLHIKETAEKKGPSVNMPTSYFTGNLLIHLEELAC